MGGLALPNFIFYNWAANICTILHWHSVNNQPPPWVQIEEASCSSSLTSLLCLPLSSPPLKYSNNIVVKNCLKLWTQFKRHFGIQSIPLLSPIHSNSMFLPSVTDTVFKALAEHGITSFKHFYIDGTFASYYQLGHAFNLTTIHLIKYLQICDFARTHFSGFPAIPSSSLVNTIFKNNPHQKGNISKLYNTLTVPNFSL